MLQHPLCLDLRKEGCWFFLRVERKFLNVMQSTAPNFSHRMNNLLETSISSFDSRGYAED